MEGWENFIVVENKERVNTREQDIVSAFNVIGTSVQRAAKITSIATRDEFRNHKANSKLLFYTWVDKNEDLEKKWTRLPSGKRCLNTADLPWKEFKNCPGTSFTANVEYDGD